MNATILSFIEKLKTDQNVLGIILFGSYARGNNSPDSDVDLVVILKEGFKRTVEFENNVAFEITYTTEEGITKFWEESPDECIDLWNIGKVLFNRDGTMQRLQKVAEEIKIKGKPGLDDESIKYLLFDNKTQLEAVRKLIETDITTANILMHNQVFHLIELFFDIRKLWKPAPKQFVQVLKKENTDFANLIIDFYTATSVNEKTLIAQKIIDGVFE